MSEFRMDEAGLFLERQLEYIRPQVFETVYADIKYPTILPVTSEAGPGAQTFTFRIMNSPVEFMMRKVKVCAPGPASLVTGKMVGYLMSA